MIRPYGSLYLVRLLEAPDSTDSGIFLPETAREPIFDALVLAAGPGHWLPNGERAPMQARVGDRVVFQRPDFVPLGGRWVPVVMDDCEAGARPCVCCGLPLWRQERFEVVWEDGTPRDNRWRVQNARVRCKPGIGCGVGSDAKDWAREQYGFVADSRLVALIPGPDHAEVRPAGDWVFLVPERSGRLAASEGGVLVAHYSLAGQDATALRRGDELHAEFVALEDTEAWRGAPTEHDRHRICWDFLEALAPWELEALGEAIERRGASSKWRAFVPYCKPPEVRAGNVVDVGPGRLGKSGHRLGYWVDTGRSVIGNRVYLERQYRGVNISDGERDLLAVRVGDLCAVES